MRRASGLVRRPEPFRNDLDDFAVALAVLIDHDRRMSAAQQGSQPLFARLNRLPPQIFAVELEQIEGTMHGGRRRPMTADEVEHREPSFVADDLLAIDQA